MFSGPLGFSPMILAYSGSAFTWFDYCNHATFHSYQWWYLLTQQYVQRSTCACCGTLSGVSLQQYHLPIALAFGRSAVVKPTRGFPRQYRLLIALAFERGAGAKLPRGFPLEVCLFIALSFERGAVAKLSRGVPLQCCLLIALTFERGAVAKLSGAFRLSVKRLGRVDSHFIIICMLGTYNP